MHAYYRGFGNLYIGWGMKNFGVGYNPPIGGPLPAQYAGNDIVEAVDPTPEEEALFQKAIGEMEADDDDEGEDDDGEAEWVECAHVQITHQEHKRTVSGGAVL